MVSVILCGILALLTYMLYKHVNRNTRAPPGPPRLPILGNLHQMAKADPLGYRAFHKLSLQYGPIMSMRVGLQEMVVLSSAEVMRDLLARDEVSGRLWAGFLVDRSMGKELGVAFASGESQRALKLFAIRSLREFGFGKRATMESIVSEELVEVKRRFRAQAAQNGGVVLMQRYFQLSLLNVLWSMMAGVKYEHDDPKLEKLLEINSAWFQSGNFGAGIVTAYPFLRFIFPESTGYNNQLSGNAAIYKYLRELVQEYRDKGTYKTDPQCFIEVFLKEIDASREEVGTYFTDEQFMVTCYDMFQAGFETTSNTMAFTILFMNLHPEVQRKVQMELDAVLPGKQTPLMEDRERLPYTLATFYESLRMSNILPISGPRKAMKDIYYRDYLIKKDTAITANTYSVMRSKEVWGDPNNFRPERFLDSNGELIDVLVKHVYLVFGLGRRSCLGETLAQTTVWMYFTTLLQNFTFELVPGEPLPTTEPIFGIILAPQPYRTLIKPRD